MLIPSYSNAWLSTIASLSRRVNANSQLAHMRGLAHAKLIKKGEC